ncbi:MAG: hypothetical protein WBD99_10950 [Thermodesulfobacteriota bacterium]
MCFSFIISVTVFAEPSEKPQNSGGSIDAFWQKFKAAVAMKDKEAIANLSKFPIEISYGAASIENKSQLLSRYHEVFDEQTNAARCFDNAQPEIEEEDPRRFTIACPDAAGNDVVIYHFEKIKNGWRFGALDNINE